MNAQPTLSFWIQTVGWLAAEITVTVGVAALLHPLYRSAHWRRALWQAALLVCGALLVVETTGVGRGLIAWTKDAPASTPPTHAQLPIYITSLPMLPSMEQVPAIKFEPAELPPYTAPLLPAVAPAIVPPPEPVSNWWIAIAWLAVAAIFAVRCALRRLLLVFVYGRAGRNTGGDWQETVRLLSDRLRLSRRVRVVCSGRFSSPVAFGWLFPVIGVPSRFAHDFSAAQQEAMLAHELAHIAANDTVWYLVADIVVAALWWHPLVWWARRRMFAASETAADEASLLVSEGPGALAESLVQLGKQLTRKPALSDLGVEGRAFRSSLGQRVNRLMSLAGSTWRPPARWHVWLARTAGSLLLLVLVIVCGAWFQPRPVDPHRSLTESLATAWRRSPAASTLVAAVGTDNPLELVAKLAPTPPVQTGRKHVKEPAPSKPDQIAEPEPVAEIPISPNVTPGAVLNAVGNGTTVFLLGRSTNFTYGFDEAFLNYFGSNGVIAVEKAMTMLNSPQMRTPANAGISEPASSPAAGVLLQFDIHPAASPGEEAINPQDVASVEASKRQAIQASVRQTLSQALMARKQNDLKTTAALFEETLAQSRRLGGVGVEVEIQQAITGLTAVRIQLAERFREQGEYGLATLEADRILAVDPGNKEAEEFKTTNVRIAKANEGRWPGRETRERTQAITAESLRVRTLIQDASALWNLSRLDEAESKLKAALRLDPENGAAHYYLNLITEARSFQEERRREESRRQSLLEVQRAWPQPSRSNPPVAELAAGSPASVPLPATPIPEQVAEKPGAAPVQTPASPLATRIFRIDTNSFLKALDRVAPVPPSSSPDNLNQRVRDFFSAAGVSLGTNSPVPTQIFFNDRTGLLMARATPTDLAIIEQAIQLLEANTVQVLIEVRIVEMPASVSKELGFDWFMGRALPDKGTNAADPRAAAQVFTNYYLPRATNSQSTSANNIRMTNPPVPNMTGILTDPQFQGVLKTLEQKNGADVLSAPRVITLNGQRAQIQINDIRTFVTGSTNTTQGLQPTTAEVATGPVIDLLPRVYADGMTIRLDWSCSVNEFLGYDPGPFQVTVSSGNGSGKVAVPLTAKLSLPSFRMREVHGTTTIYDGDTIVIGGGAVTHTQKEKVPALGDLPLFSRMFRSEKKEVRHMIIFITPTIIDPAGNRVHNPDSKRPDPKDD